MNCKVVKVVFSWFLVMGICFPLSMETGNVSGSLTGQAWALSSESMPLTSNIFVDIAKQQNPAVVNVSMSSKAKKASPRRQTPPAPPGLPRDPRAPGGPGQKDPFRDFYDKFLDKRPYSQPPRRGEIGRASCRERV